jgi:type IV pilus assembly protein PilX
MKARIHGLRRSNRGVALVFVLLMMSMAVAMAVISARLTLLGDKATRNDRDRQLAFQSAELALNDAEIDVFDPVQGTRSCKFGGSGGTFVPAPGCSKEDATRGFCELDPSAPTTPLYRLIDWNDTSADRKWVKLGEFTGRADELQVGAAGTGPAKVPRYIIIKGQGGIMRAGTVAIEPKGAYVIYALGYGANPDTQVLLEAQITKPLLDKACAEGSSL